MVRRFTILSLVVFLAFGVVTGLLVAREVTSALLSSYALAMANTQKTTISDQLRASDLERPMTGRRYSLFSEFIAKSVISEEIVKVKLWNREGTVIYSSDPTIVGKRFPMKDNLQQALAGRVSSHITNLRAPENSSESASFNRLVEIYVPMYLSTDDRVTGVWETYISTTPVDAQIRRTNQIVFSAMVILFLVLFAIVTAASRILRLQNEKLRSMSSQLKAKAERDGLTGLYNHQHFEEYLQTELERCHRYNRPVSLLMVDLDFFKEINDRFGHQIGDKVLREVADMFVSLLRDIDYVARYGGEEFVAVLPETPAKEALQVAERMRASGEKLALPFLQDRKTPISMSIGVADFPACAREFESLIAAADTALLFAKQHGRNRVCYFRDLKGNSLEDNELEKLYGRLENASLSTLEALAGAVDAKSINSSGHASEVTELADRVAPALGLDPYSAQMLHLAAQLHDVGKVAISSELLDRPGSLSASELMAIRAHPEISHRIVRSAAKMEHVLSAILHHHENFDGSGYPQGLSGEQIPLLARILRIIDSYQAMTSKRSYRESMTHDEAVEELRRNAGSQFDPVLVEKLISALEHARSTKSDPAPLTEKESVAGPEPVA